MVAVQTTNSPVRLLFRPIWNLILLFASLQVAVVLISLLAVTLAIATLVEWRWGSEAAQFGIYRAWWFFVLIFLLGLSVIFSAVVRFPWKKHHLGFLVTHFGIVVLLVGCVFSLWGGIDAQLPVFEGQTAHQAFTQDYELLIKVYDWGRTSTSGQRETLGDRGRNFPANHTASTEFSAPGSNGFPRIIRIPFHPGPFNWADYRSWPILLWSVIPRTQGILFAEEGIQLEVTDYYSNAEVTPAPPLRLQVKSAGGAWEELQFEVHGFEDPRIPHRTFGLGNRRELKTGHSVVFWVASSRAETEAFLRSIPSGKDAGNGEVFLFHRGLTQRFLLPDFLNEKVLRWDEAGVQIKFVQFNPRFSGLVLDPEPYPERLPVLEEISDRMVLFADMVEFNRHSSFYGIFGTLWLWTEGTSAAKSGGTAEEITEGTVNSAEETASNRSGSVGDSPNLKRSRLDILQGTDGVLYFRSWHAGMVQESGILPADGRSIQVFKGSGKELEVRVAEFLPADKPGVLIRPLPLRPQVRGVAKRSFARVRLTLDGWQEEFWLEALPATPFLEFEEKEKEVWIAGDRRTVALSLLPKIIDLGFVVKLHEFERRLEPGSTHPASYGSRVDILSRQRPTETILRNVWISMNRPLSVVDPSNGRTYRIYQEAFRGPFRAGDPLFERVVQGREPREQLYLSWLTLNYDPGRGLKYLGSFLIVVGTATLFYMRGYLRRGKDRPSFPGANSKI